jgi:DNA-binding LacI/PurR family transcriptional regulator
MADVMVVEGQDSTVAEGAAAAEWLLTRQPRPTALLCLSDRLAQGAVRAAAKHGLGVPRDLSVVGFDDASPPGPGRITPPLTSVHQPHRDKGLLAAEILFAEMRGGDVHNPSPLPVELVVRATTGPPPPDA